MQQEIFQIQRDWLSTNTNGLFHPDTVQADRLGKSMFFSGSTPWVQTNDGTGGVVFFTKLRELVRREWLKTIKQSLVVGTESCWRQIVPDSLQSSNHILLLWVGVEVIFTVFPVFITDFTTVKYGNLLHLFETKLGVGVFLFPFSPLLLHLL